MMTIKNGKFYKDGVQVPIEHGNKEQIEALKRIEDMSSNGFTPEIAVKKIVSMQFDCICGALCEFDDFTPLDEDDLIEMLVDEKDSCNQCGMAYMVIYDVDGVMLKMIPKKP